MDFFKKYLAMIGQSFYDLILIDVFIDNHEIKGKFKCVCGNEIIQNPNVIIKGDTKSCGCKQKSDRQKQRGQLIGKVFHYLMILDVIPGSKGKASFCKCQCRCGNIKLIRTNAILRETTKSCGCWRLEVSRRKGKDHNSFNHNISDEHRYLRDVKKRVSKEYNFFRNAVKKRDCYKCRICGSPYCLRVHHLESYAKNEGLRYDANNGIVLCETCHNIFHYLFNQFNNTKKQYEHFEGMYYTLGLTYLKTLYLNKQRPESFWYQFYNLSSKLLKTTNILNYDPLEQIRLLIDVVFDKISAVVIDYQTVKYDQITREFKYLYKTIPYYDFLSLNNNFNCYNFSYKNIELQNKIDYINNFDYYEQ